MVLCVLIKALPESRNVVRASHCIQNMYWLGVALSEHLALGLGVFRPIQVYLFLREVVSDHDLDCLGFAWR